MASRYIRGPAGVPCQLPVLPVPPKPSPMGPVSVEATGVQLGLNIMEEHDARGRLCWELAEGGAVPTPTPCASPANLASPSTFPTSLRRCCGRERPLLGGDLVRKSLEGF